MSQNLIVLSKDPVTNYFLEKENLQELIISLCPMNEWTVRIVLSFHITALFSKELPTKYSLSMEKQTSVTPFYKLDSV